MIDWRTLAQLIGVSPAALCHEWLATEVAHGPLLAVEDRPDAEIQAAIDKRRQAAIARRQGAVAVVPVRGVIIPRPNIWELYGVATSVQTVVALTRTALADPNTKAVVHAYDSPGGSTAGVPEAWAQLHAMRGDKPIIAVAEHLMASAAYWLASAADEIVAAPSALVGSIGVYMLHLDYSAALEAEGIKPTFVHAGENKVEGNPYEPLGDDARAHYQAMVDDVYQQFTGDVARGRGAKASAVRGEAYGQGRVLTASAALGAGMIDQVRTLEQTLAAYGMSTQDNRPQRASAIERRRRALGLIERGL